MIHFKTKDPFENLNEQFKAPEEVDILLSINPTSTVSFALVIFQMISFQLKSLTDDEIAHFAEYKYDTILIFLKKFYFSILQLFNRFLKLIV